MFSSLTEAVQRVRSTATRTTRKRRCGGPYQWRFGPCGKISQLRIRHSDIRRNSAQTLPRQTGNLLLSPLWMTVSSLISPTSASVTHVRQGCYRWYRKLPGFQMALKLDHQPSGTVQRAGSEEGLCMGLRIVHRCSGDYIKKPMKDCTGKEITPSGCTTWVFR